MGQKSSRQRGASGWVATANIVEALLDRFGWPGALLIYAIYFIERNATQGQKQDLIEMYLLGRGISTQYPLFIFAIILVCAFLAQRHYYRKKLKLMEQELARVGEWKTAHQEKQVGVPLHHTLGKED